MQRQDDSERKARYHNQGTGAPTDGEDLIYDFFYLKWRPNAFAGGSEGEEPEVSGSLQKFERRSDNRRSCMPVSSLSGILPSRERPRSGFCNRVNRTRFWSRIQARLRTWHRIEEFIENRGVESHGLHQFARLEAFELVVKRDPVRNYVLVIEAIVKQFIRAGFNAGGRA